MDVQFYSILAAFLLRGVPEIRAYFWQTRWEYEEWCWWRRQFRTFQEMLHEAIAAEEMMIKEGEVILRLAWC